MLGLVPLWFSRLRPLERAFERHDCQHGVRTLFSIQRTVGILVLSQPWRAALSARITAMHARRSLPLASAGCLLCGLVLERQQPG